MQVCFRHWRALSLSVGGSCFRSGSLALWRPPARAKAPAPYWLARGRRQGGSARAQRRAPLRADRQGWGLFLRGASAACFVFSVSPALPLRRFAFAYTCGRRFQSGDGSRWSPSPDCTLRSTLSLACFQPLRPPFCFRAVPPCLPPRRQCLQHPFRPMRPRGLRPSSAPAFSAGRLPLCPPSSVLGLHRLVVALSRHLTSTRPTPARRHARRTLPATSDAGGWARSARRRRALRLPPPP